MIYLTPDINGTVPSGQCKYQSRTCRGRCREPQLSYIFLDDADEIKSCHCDELCLYLGDCCYNYLHECRSKNYTLEEGIKKQAEIFLQRKPFLQCVVANIKAAMHGGFIAYEELAFAMVATCPLSADERHARPCNQAVSQGITARTPVYWKGFLYRNIFCATCHGAPLSEVEWLRSELVCNGSGSYWHQNGVCAKIRISVDDAPVDMVRLYDYCLDQKCMDVNKRHCPDKDPHAQECWAYYAAVLVEGTGEERKYRNEACQRCDPNPIIVGSLNCHPKEERCPFKDKVIPHQPWMQFFDFTGRYRTIRR